MYVCVIQRYNIFYINQKYFPNIIGVPFHLTHHEFFYLEGIKKYVIADSNNITIKGHRFQPDEVVGIMKSKMRNKKIDSLLND